MATIIEQQIALDESLVPSHFKSLQKFQRSICRSSGLQLNFITTLSVSRSTQERVTMATTIDQQVALDEALVPSTQRLRIGKSNFRLPSDIQSKESTLQVVYDVL
nr:hypothetical protein [Tanacetum cinerariifolium]